MRRLWYLLTELRTAPREAGLEQGKGTRVKSEITSKSSSARVTASWSTLKIKITKYTVIKISASTCENN